MPGIFTYDHMRDPLPNDRCEKSKSKDKSHNWQERGYKCWECKYCKRTFQQ